MKVRYFTFPNIITLGNLLCGMTAIVYALWDADLKTAFWFIILAAVFDFMDGFTARLTGQYSPLGKQLDSLADMVSFGVAPSAMLFEMCIQQGGSHLSFAMFIVAAFSALRLARFNIDEEQGEEFIGLATPASAIFFSSAVWLYTDGAYTIHPLWMLAGVVFMSCLMISPLRMFSLKFHGYGLGDRNNVMRYAFLALSLAGILIFRVGAVPFIILGYIAISVGRNLVCLKSDKSAC